MPKTAEFTKLTSHVIGSDHVGRRVDVREGEGEPQGLYGSSGFYFQVLTHSLTHSLSLLTYSLTHFPLVCVCVRGEQQRRGRLDLRSLAQIDLEKVVRDVDIDVLQVSRVTLCE